MAMFSDEPDPKKSNGGRSFPGLPAQGFEDRGRPKGPAAPVDEPDDVVEQRIQDQALKATEIYSLVVSAARDVYRSVQDPKALPDPPKALLSKLVTVLQSGNQELLALADRSAPDN